MDLLTHIFLPLTAAYALRPDLFPNPRYFTIAFFGAVPDVDKFFGSPGLFHSVLVTIPASVFIVLVGRRYRSLYGYTVLAVLLLHSHLLLDILDGGPVTVLYPFRREGIGLTYPTQLVFKDVPPGVVIQHPLPEIRVRPTAQGRTTYPPINGYGVLSALLFLTVYGGRRIKHGMAGETA